VSRQDLKSWELSNVYAKGTSGQARSCALRGPIFLMTALLVVSSVFSPGVRAAVDLASRVGLQVVARPGNASDSSQDFELRDGSVLRTGDGVQLRLESDADAYVYVIAYGSTGTAILLHPFSARAEDARVRPGHLQVIPSADVFLPLDEREGRETLFTIVSDTPLADIRDLIRRIEAQSNDPGAIGAMIETRYPGVRRLTFKHIGAQPLVGVAAVVPRPVTSPANPAPAGGDSGADAAGSVGLLPPAGGGWSVSSNQAFGADEASAEPPASTAAVVSPPAPQPAAPPPRQAGASASVGDAGSAPVSAALREARKAAGIDESEFRGILATLPDSSEVGVPTSLRNPYKEQGVLSAEGSRIRPLGRMEIGSDVENRSQN
jgi:hypothetical protein